MNRIVRVREWGPDLFGRAQNRWRVIRTTNAYTFRDPQPGAGRQVLLSPNFRLEPKAKSLISLHERREARFRPDQPVASSLEPIRRSG